MPRTKVRVEDRQRAVRACVPCKSSKKRCDSHRPCSNCCQRNCKAACIYDAGGFYPPRSAKSGYISTRPSMDGRSRTPAQSMTFHEDIETESTSYDDPASMSARQAPYIPDSTLRSCSDSNPNIPASPRVPIAHGEVSGGRTMIDSRGEKVCMGDSASLSFLHFLRRTLSHYMGPSPFTDNERANVMLEAIIPIRTSDDVPVSHSESHLNLEEKREYVERFFITTTGLVYLFSPQQLSEMLDEREKALLDIHSPEVSQKYGLRDAIVDLTIAIGAQCCETTSKSLYLAQKHFERAQKMAFEGMLLDPSLDMICAFLLMSMYMLGACKRNGAFMYLGVAARSAHALGLHVPESYHQLEPTEQRFRSQIWKSLRILDIAISSVLSRPPASSSGGPLEGTFMTLGDGLEPPSPEFLAMSSSFEACTILEQVMDYLDHKRDVSLVSIEEFLTRLREWSQSLPSNVRFSSVSWPMSTEKRRQALGNFAVSCFYYFSVILITRPILISHLLMKLRLLNPSAAASGAPAASPPEAEQIAQVCIDAAILMAETARRAQSAGLLTQNMCLLKAWLFSASLVLGFSIFVDASCSSTPTSFEAETALHGSINVIKDLARTSPQAHHYLDVLTEFLDAIKKHRERMVPSRRKSSGKYLSQIFVLDQGKALSADTDMESMPLWGSMGPPSGADTSNAGLWMLHQAAEATQGVGDFWRLPEGNAGCNDSGLPGSIAASVSVPMGAFDLDWGSSNLQVTENSLFEPDPFMSMLDQS